MTDFEKMNISGTLHFIYHDVLTGNRKRISAYKNIIVSIGRNMLIKRLAGEGNDCNITYGAIGTGATTPAIADTTLDTELVRKLVSTISFVGNELFVTIFFGAFEANGYLTEFGLFGEAASLTADSGTMFNHASILENKSQSETMTINVTITIN